jgi:hypothetical protein
MGIMAGLVINTSNWWMGKKVLVSPQWITQVSAEENTILIDLPPSHPAL